MSGSLRLRIVPFTILMLLSGFILGCGAKPKDEKQRADSKPPVKTSPDSAPVRTGEVPPPAPHESPLPREAPPRGSYGQETVDEHDYHVIKVFYATDRKPAGIEGRSGWNSFLAFYSLPTALGLLTLGLLVAGFRTKHLLRYGFLALVAAGVMLFTTQKGTLKAQREESAIATESRQYGADRHEDLGAPILEMGLCEVSVPPDHRVGKVESPSVLKLEFREDPQKHVVIHKATLLPEDSMLSELRACISESNGEQALVFIHGYNVSFDDAIKRTAQIAYDLDFDGAPICYSWPSQGGFEKYTYDEESIRWTVPQLERFLNTIVERSGAKTIHLVAHSMGNRALVEVLERIYLQDKDDHYTFGQIILAAPDVDSSTFRNRYVPILKEMSQRTTLYASSNDRALLASTKFHGYTRAGLSGDALLALAGVETVDASPIDTSLIGHSYYGNNPIMIRDLQALIREGIPASARTWLQQILKHPEVFYWRFRDQLPELDGAGDAPSL